MRFVLLRAEFKSELVHARTFCDKISEVKKKLFSSNLKLCKGISGMCKSVFMLFILSLFISFMFSCSNSSRIDYSDEEDSLKNALEKKINSVSWTKELEENRLSSSISSVDSVEKNIRLTPSVFLNSRFSSELNPIYPYLEGFGSLNIAGFDSQIKLMAERFSDLLLKGTVDDSFFNKEDVFELALFMKDLKDSWQDVFGEPYPSKEKDGEQANEANLESEDAAVLEDESEISLFDDYIIGEPFEMNSLYEVPVRFIRNDVGFVDIIFFFFKKADAWNINQLRILNMEAF